MTDENKKEVEKEILITQIDNSLKTGKLNEWIKKEDSEKQLKKKDRDKITNHFDKYFDQDMKNKTDKSEWKEIIESIAEEYSKEGE